MTGTLEPKIHILDTEKQVSLCGNAIMGDLAATISEVLSREGKYYNCPQCHEKLVEFLDDE